MKKIIVVCISLAIMLMVTIGHAQVRERSFTISPNIGNYTFEANEDMKNNLTVGIRAGYNFTKYIGVEGFFNYVPTEIKLTNEQVSSYVYGIEGLVHIFPKDKLVPYLAVGVGGLYYSVAYQDTTEDKKNKFSVDYGYGIKYFINEDVALRFDVRHVMPFSDFHNNLLMSIGLSFAFGGAKKAAAVTEGSAVQQAAAQQAAPVEVVSDSDNDGVPDKMDKCPDTPAGVAIDNDGCPVDSDNDGVPDYLDKCPGTPYGVKVDKKGCPPPPPAALTTPPAPPVQEMKREAEMAKEIQEKGRTTLSVLFDTNKSLIKKTSFQEIDHFAAVMKKYPELKVIIEGHTDSVGNKALNKKLSQRRAEAVKKYLVSKGIDGKRLAVKGYGMEKPIASNKTKEGRQKNRRVEAVVDYLKKK